MGLSREQVSSSVLDQLKKLYYETNQHFNISYFKLLVSEIMKPNNFIPEAKLTKVTLHRLGKNKRRYSINVVCRYHFTKTERKLKDLKNQRLLDTHSSRLVSKKVFETSKTFSMTPAGSTKGDLGHGVIYRKNTGWQFNSSEFLPIIKNIKNEYIDTQEEELIAKIGKVAFNALKQGRATLNLWRGSEPYNWYIKTKTGKMLWHSDTSKVFDMPPINLFEKVSDSKETIRVPETFFKIPGNGNPELTVFKLSKYKSS